MKILIAIGVIVGIALLPFYAIFVFFFALLNLFAFCLMWVFKGLAWLLEQYCDWAKVVFKKLDLGILDN